MGSKTKREVIHLPASSTKETVSYVLGWHIKNQKAADILGPCLTMPKTRNGNKVSIDFPTGWPSMCFEFNPAVQAGEVLSVGPACLSFFSHALGTLASLFFTVQQVHPSFGLGIHSSLFSECCAPGFVKLSLSCHSGFISNVSFPSTVFTSSHFKVPTHCSKSPLPSTSPPSHAGHWVSWQCLIFLRCPFQGMSWFLAHCRGRVLFPSWSCQMQGPVSPMAMLLNRFQFSKTVKHSSLCTENIAKMQHLFYSKRVKKPDVERGLPIAWWLDKITQESRKHLN